MRILATRWFWYSILCLLFFAAYLLVSKLGVKTGLDDRAMFLLFIWGELPVALALLGARQFRLETPVWGIFHGLMIGVLGGAGQWAMLKALAVPDGNTSVISAVTGLYPMVTVVLAVCILRERLSGIQLSGLLLAGVAIVIFSLDPAASPIGRSLGGGSITAWGWPTAMVLAAWGAVGIFQKLATVFLSAEATLVWQTAGLLGYLPFFQPVQSLTEFPLAGLVYGLLGGATTSIGAWFLFAALRHGGKISLVAPIAALYPLIVIMLAPWVLHESITWIQSGGVLCALAAIVLLSM